MIAGAGDAPPEGARVIDLEGRTLMPGLIDAHQHATAGSLYFCKSANEAGTEEIWPGAAAHVVAQVFRELLRMGITTFRDVGGYDDTRRAGRGDHGHDPRRADRPALHLVVTLPIPTPNLTSGVPGA